MKIQKIFIKNLNSLAGEHTIDFTVKPLSEASLFAITGPTGAGKSSILDAICLAMYDQSPRMSKASKSSIEETGALVSRGALETEAMVEYEQSGIIYRSRWTIRFARTGALSERKMELSIFDPVSNVWPIISARFSEVPLKNGEITKLDYGQFTRSVLLAQGEFAKLLSANKEDRYNLMEKITGDDTYRRIGKKVFEIATGWKKDIDSAEAEVKGMTFLSEEEIQSINLEIQNLRVKISENEAASKKLSALIQIKQQIEGKKNELDLTSIEFEKWGKKNLQFLPNRIRLERFEKARPVFINLNTYRLKNSHLKNLQEKKENIDSRLDKLKADILNKMGYWSGILRIELNNENFQEIFTKELNKIKLAQDKLELANKAFTIAEEEHNKVDKEFQLKHKQYQKTGQEIISKEKEIVELLEKVKPYQLLLTQFNQLARWEALNANLQKDGVRLTKETGQNVITSSTNATKFLSGQLNEISRQITEISALGNANEIKIKLSNLIERRIILLKAKDGFSELKQLSEEEDFLNNTNNKNVLELDKFNTQLKIVGSRKETLQNEKEQALKKLKFASAAQDLEALRAELSDGEPCPLCGSSHHPGIEELRYKELQQKQIDTEANFLNIEIEEKLLLGEIVATQTKEELAVARIGIIHLNIQQTKDNKITPVSKSENCTLESIDEVFTDMKLREIDVAREQLESINLKLNQIADLGLKQQLLSAQIEKVTQWESDWKTLAQEVSITELIDAPDILNNYLTDLSVKKNLNNLLEKDLVKCQNELNSFKVSEKGQKQTFDEIKLQLENRFTTLDKETKSRDQLKLIVDEMPKVEKPSTILQTEGTKIMQLLNDFSNQTKLSHDTDEEEKKADNDLRISKEELDRASEAVGFESILELEEAELSAEEEKQFVNERESLKTMFTKITTSNDSLSKEIVKLEERDDKSIELEKAIQDSDDFSFTLGEANQQKGGLTNRLNQNKILQTTYAEKLVDIDSKKLKAKPFQILNDLIGDSVGKRFNEYAQELTLRRLLMAANANLAAINQRYELDMPNSKEDGNSLYVIDKYMGDSRRAADITLSGGESFMVSLALALGLSDLAVGKAELGNLFIDEGFGSLDSETLDSAIGILEELQHKRGRVIGIISHVSELKERITTQLKVEKKAGGVSSILQT